MVDVLSCNSTYRLRYWNKAWSIILYLKFKSCNSTYRLRYWNGLGIDTKPSNLTLLVATVLTVYGIETQRKRYYRRFRRVSRCNSTYRLRYWNQEKFTETSFSSVLGCNSTYRLRYWNFATDAVVVSPLSRSCNSTYRLRYWNVTISFVSSLHVKEVATVLTVYGIETFTASRTTANSTSVATVLTVYGIETYQQDWKRDGFQRLQQYLPFTVLKLAIRCSF